MTISTLPGLTLWHEGQFEGRRVRLAVFLARRPEEPLDEDLRRFHTELIADVGDSRMREGRWQLLPCTGWPDNSTHENLAAWAWEDDGRRHLVVVNLSPDPAQGRVPLPWPDLRGRSWRLAPVVAGGETLDRDGDELLAPGLFVALPGWGSHVVTVADHDAPSG